LFVSEELVLFRYSSSHVNAPHTICRQGT
jgi:hypothetical protein